MTTKPPDEPQAGPKKPSAILRCHADGEAYYPGILLIAQESGFLAKNVLWRAGFRDDDLVKVTLVKRGKAKR